jgi:tRNA-Thr(GGU) m(6)t(6)A37 methyltransferase TsaA
VYVEQYTAKASEKKEPQMTTRDHATPYELRPIGWVRSILKQREECPHQGWEGAPEAWLEIAPEFLDGLDGILPGRELIVLTWFHLAQREVLKVHPRGNPARPLRGVFSTRSPDRPNPIGLHRVAVIEIADGCRVRVKPLEALDGTPVIDLKPVLAAPPEA